MTDETDIHAAERVRHPFMTWKGETPVQRLAVHQRRAVQAVINNPEWDDEKLGEEWGISPALVSEARSKRATHGGTYVEKAAPKSEKPSLPARVVGALWGRLGHHD